MYRRFILYRAKPGTTSSTICFESSTSVTWADARDRLEAAGFLEGYKAGSWDDGWMLSVDTAALSLVPTTNWQPLP